MTLEIERRHAPVYRDATVRVGQRTAIGDAYVDLRRGTPAAGALAPGAAIGRVRGTVEFDEAFATLDERTRGDAVAFMRTLGRGARLPRTAPRWGRTVDELARTTHELRGLTRTLRGQGRELSGLVDGSRVALRELGERERMLGSLVRDSRRTLAAFAGRRRELADGLRELPPLLSTARGVLARARPLLVATRPVARDLGGAAPQLAATFDALRPTADDARATLAALPRFNATARPFLRRTLPVVDVARPFARRLFPLLQNAVPMLRYLEPRAPELAAWFSNTRAMGQRRDGKGRWVRFLIFQEPFSGIGARNGAALSRNAYSRPGDARAPAPFAPGSYPRLQPFTPTPDTERTDQR